MFYTIASLYDVREENLLSFCRNGNYYHVSLYNTVYMERTSMNYKEFDDAYSVFEKLSRLILSGCYAYEKDKKLLSQEVE